MKRISDNVFYASSNHEEGVVVVIAGGGYLLLELGTFRLFSIRWLTVSNFNVTDRSK